MFVSKDFFAALDALESEKRIKKEEYLEMLEAGLVAAYKKQYGETRNMKVVINPQDCSIKTYAYRTVVEEVEDPDTQVSLEEAKKIDSKVTLGGALIQEITPKKDFSRQAAATAKQVIVQRLHDLRKEQLTTEIKEKDKEIVSRIVSKVENGIVYVEIAGMQMQGIMMEMDQIKGEHYIQGKEYKVFIKRIDQTSRGPRILVSRSCQDFVRKLFQNEVPEIKHGLVTIRNIVRDAGVRTKIAVVANDPMVDAVGSCVGENGVRINSIVHELNDEKIDIIKWCEDPAEYIARALSPSEVVAVSVNNEAKSARAIVPDKFFSLAIGSQGNNVKLAAKLTGWKIDIKKYSEIDENL